MLFIVMLVICDCTINVHEYTYMRQNEYPDLAVSDDQSQSEETRNKWKVSKDKGDSRNMQILKFGMQQAFSKYISNPIPSLIPGPP